MGVVTISILLLGSLALMGSLTSNCEECLDLGRKYVWLGNPLSLEDPDRYWCKLDAENFLQKAFPPPYAHSTLAVFFYFWHQWIV